MASKEAHRHLMVVLRPVDLQARGQGSTDIPLIVEAVYLGLEMNATNSSGHQQDGKMTDLAMM